MSQTTPWLLPLAAWLALQALPAAALDLPGPLADGTCTGACGGSAADGDITLSPVGHAAHGWVSTAGSDATGVSPLALPTNSRGNGTETNGSRWVSPSFQAQAGDQVSVWFNYVSTDGKGFDDYAWARLVDAGGATAAWLFTARSSKSSTGNIVPGDVVDKSAFDPRDALVGYKDWTFTSKDAADPVDWSHLGASNGTCWKDNAPGCGFTGWLESRHAIAASGSYRLEVGVVNWGDTAYDSGLAFDHATLSVAAAVPEPGIAGLMLAGGLGLAGWLAGRRRRPAARITWR